MQRPLPKNNSNSNSNTIMGTDEVAELCFIVRDVKNGLSWTWKAENKMKRNQWLQKLKQAMEK